MDPTPEPKMRNLCDFKDQIDGFRERNSISFRTEKSLSTDIKAVSGNHSMIINSKNMNKSLNKINKNTSAACHLCSIKLTPTENTSVAKFQTEINQSK